MRAFAGLFALVALAHCSNGTTVATSRVDGSLPPPDAGRHDSGKTHVPPILDAAPDSPGAPVDAQADCAVPDAFTEAGVACGSRTGMRGLTQRSVVVGCKTRTYLVYLPSSYDPTKPMPFVFVFHGLAMSGAEMEAITQYTTLAETEGFGLAFPDGDDGPNTFSAPWNIASPSQMLCGAGGLIRGSGDDFAFIDAMKAEVAEDQCLDPAHVYSTGFSMGGYFTHHIACYRSDMRAAAPHSGGTLADLSACTTGHVPIIMFHGKADDVIDDACDDPTVTPDVGFTASAELWAAKNGCKNTYETVKTNGDAGPDAGGGQCLVYDGCPDGGQVEVCTFDGMGHCWAGGDEGPDADVNACPGYAHATELEWAFFKKYAW